MRILHVLSLACIAGTSCAQTTAFTHAINFGAATKVVFRVVDDRGHPVTNALVKAGFYLNGKAGNSVNSYTGPGGLLVAERKSVGEINYWINKAGHYETSGRFNFERNGVSDGRWQPYGMTNTVVLKRKVNPVAMCVRPNRKGLTPLVPPYIDQYIGFDMEKGDWVRPHGDGIYSDISLKYEYKAGSIPSLYYRGAVFLLFTNKYDGAYAMTKDCSSSFQSAYHADTNAVYRQKMGYVYDRLTGVVNENSKFPESCYLVLRVRSKTGKAGNLISANYAKMYGPIAAGAGGIYMGFYFNPNTNDPNLEADTTKNLLNPGDLGFAP